MTHETLQRRLEALEESRALRHRAACQIIHITFPPVDPQFAEGPHGFRCDRLPHESLKDFECRCSAELLSHINQPKIPPILIYGPGPG
jgi:hypothetical protein